MVMPTQQNRMPSVLIHTAGLLFSTTSQVKTTTCVSHPVAAPAAPTSMGGLNSLPIADMAPITIMGHKAYGIFH